MNKAVSVFLFFSLERTRVLLSGDQMKVSRHAAPSNVPLSAFFFFFFLPTTHWSSIVAEPCGRARDGLHPLTHIICESMLLLGLPSQRPVHRVRESGNERERDVYAYTLR